MDTKFGAVSRQFARIPRVRDLLTVSLTFFSAYIVIGGIWVGKTASFSDLNPFVVYFALTVAITLIAGLEGLQISVSSLSRKDLEEVKNYYPRAYELHKEFKLQDSTVQQFFAGRQLFIVAIVFIASRFTAFPEMTEFPFTGVVFPAIIVPWFDVIFLDFGLIGALFVYWFGNLTSQLVATEHPVAFLNLPGLGVLFSACIFIDRIGLPRTSKLLSNFFGAKVATARDEDYPDRIPLSAEQKYRRELENDSGFGISSMIQRWSFRDVGLNIRYSVTYEIGRRGISTIRDTNFSLPRSVSPNNLNFTPILKRVNETVDQNYLESDMSEQTVGNYTEYTMSVTEPIGDFEIGDEITFVLDINVSASPAAFHVDRLRIDHPAKYIELHVEFDESIYTIDIPTLSISNPVHAQTEGINPAEATALPLENPSDGNVYAKYEKDYPKQGSVYELEWNATERSSRPHDSGDRLFSGADYEEEV